MGTWRTRWRARLVVGAAVGLAWLLAGTTGQAAGSRASSDGVVRDHVGVLAHVATPPGPVPSAVGDVTVTSSTGYLYDSGGTSPGVAVVGQVINRSGTRRTGIVVRADFFVGSTMVGTVSGPIALERLAWGSVSPFLVVADSPPFETSGIDGFVATVSVEGVGTSPAPDGALDIVTGPTTVDGDAEIRWFSGTIGNPNPFAASEVAVTISTWDAGGAILDVGGAGTTPVTIPAHGTASYLVPVFYDPQMPVARSVVVVDGDTDDGEYLTSWANYFDDVGTSQFRPDIVWLAEHGVTTGCGAGRFCPSASVPRDQMASFLVHATGLAGTAPDAFTDDEGNVHEPNINLVAQAGISYGCAPALYCPSATVPRDQMASFLARAANLGGTAPDAFTDDDSDVHERNINLVAKAGIASGCGPGIYCPYELVTRGQMAAFLRRAFD